MVQLAEAMGQRGYRVGLSLPENVEPPNKAITDQGGQIQYLYRQHSTLQPYQFSWDEYVELVQQLQAHQPKLVHFHNPSHSRHLTGYLACLRMNVPYVVHFHSPLPWHPPTGRLGKLKKMFLVQLLKRAQKLIAVSNTSRQLVEKGGELPDQLWEIVHNSIDVQEFAQPNPQQVQELRQTFKADQHVLLTTVARLSPEKGYTDLIEAIPRILHKIPNARFLWAGEGGARNQIETQIQARGLEDHVEFLGHREDVPALLGASDVFLFPSRHESFGIVFVEALAAGLPIVANDINAAREVVGGYPFSYLIDAKDENAWIEAIQRALSQRDLEQRQQAQQYAQQFDREQMANKMQKVYRRLNVAPAREAG